MEANQKAAFVRINELLEEIKGEINDNWVKGAQLTLLIEDQHNSPLRSRKEDIEPGVNKLEIS